MCAIPYLPGSFHEMLTATRDEIRTRRHDLTIELAAEAAENSTLYQLRDQAAGAQERDTRKLAEVLAALQRLESGCFGICLTCDEAIGRNRLLSVPWASECLSCAEAAERTRRGREVVLEDEA